MEIRKKTAFITALTLSVALLTGCDTPGNEGTGKDNVLTTESVTEAAAETESSENGTEETVAVSETAAVTEKAAEKTGNKEATGYEEALRAYYEAENNNDYEAIINGMYPSKLVDYMFTISGITAEEMAADLGTTNSHYEVTDIITEGEIESGDLDTLTMTYDVLHAMYSKLEAEGKTMDDLTDAERSELAEVFYSGEPNPDTPKVYKATEGYDVTVKYTLNGEPDEDYFYVYYIEGDGWKLNNSMRKFVKNAKQNSMNSNAKSLFTAAQTALMEAEASGTDLSGAYIISSDPSKSINVPSGFDVKQIEEFTGFLADGSDEYEYFIVASNAVCHYVVLHKNADEYGVGVYPVNTLPDTFDGKTLSYKSVDKVSDTIDDLYDMCVDLIK